MISLLDSNVLIRFLTCDKDQKYKNLYSFFESLEKGDLRVELKLIVIFQVIFVLKNFYKVPKNQIVKGMMDLLKYRGIAIKEKKIVNRTLELWQESSVEIVDCYLIACLEKDAQSIVYSYGRDFDRFNITRKAP